MRRAWRSLRTGYGNQTRLFWWRIQKHLGHKMTLISNYGLQGSTLNLEFEGEATTVYPLGYDRHGNDILAAHAQHVGADIVITLYDSWCFRPQATSVIRWAPWLPVDHEPLPDPVKNALRTAWQPIVYSRFGERMLRDAGLDPLYVPHGVDTKVFAPLDNRIEARERLGLPKEPFIAAMVAANKGTPSRKSFPEVFAVWAAFVKEHPAAVLYLHTHAGQEMQGLPLQEVAKHCGIPKDNLVFCDQYFNLLGYPDRYMVDVYNAADVLLSPSQGEGFGIPILEAQACGTPVIVGDWTSMPELCFGGWRVTGQRLYTPLGAWQHVPTEASIYEALSACHGMTPTQVRKMRKKCRAGALEYDVDRVLETYWRPVLDTLAERVRLAEGEENRAGVAL